MDNKDFQWTDALATEWAGYINKKQDYLRIGEVLEQWKKDKIRKPLLRTHDGVDVFPGDVVYSVHRRQLFLGRDEGYQVSNITNIDDYWYFSTLEASKIYVVYNKRTLSYSDVVEFLSPAEATELAKLIKSRL